MEDVDIIFVAWYANPDKIFIRNSLDRRKGNSWSEFSAEVCGQSEHSEECGQSDQSECLDACRSPAELYLHRQRHAARESILSAQVSSLSAQAIVLGKETPATLAEICGQSEQPESPGDFVWD